MDCSKVLEYQHCHPRPGEENLEFLSNPALWHVSELMPVKVVSPVPVIDYAANGQRPNSIPHGRQDGNVEVFYPRWIYPPQGGFLNSWFLAGPPVPFIRNLRDRYEFDIIDSHFGHPVGVAAGLVAAALKCPYTITLRGNETMHARAAGAAPLDVLGVPAGGAHHYRFRKPAAVRHLSRGDPARARTIPNGIDSDLFYPRPSRKPAPASACRRIVP